MAAREDGRFDVATDAGQRFVAKAVVIAAGVGSFQPRGLKIEGLVAWRERQLFHRDPGPEATAGRRVVIVGNGDAAVTAALDAVEAGAASVTIVHRRDDFDAPPLLLLRFQSARMNDLIEVVTAQPSAVESEGEVLAGPRRRRQRRQHADARRSTCCSCSSAGAPSSGRSPSGGWRCERKQLVVDTERFETSIPGIYAIGDVVTYPGKQKLIVSRLSRGDARRLRDRRAGVSRSSAAAALHDHQPEAAQAARRGPGESVAAGFAIISSALRLEGRGVSARGVGRSTRVERATETVPLNLTEVILAQGSSRIGRRSSRAPSFGPPTCHRQTMAHIR